MSIEEKRRLKKIQFFEAIDKILPFSDWNEQLIAATEKECDFVQGYNFALFPGGIKEIIKLYEAWRDQQMLEALKNLDSNIKIREKIALALKTRIKSIGPKIIYIKNSCYFAIPSNLMLGTNIAWETCDKIWKFAGDTATDFNYYSKRGLLLGVYLSTIMFYISDSSENHGDTDAFIVSAIDNIINIAKLKDSIKFPDFDDIPIVRFFS